MHIDKLNTIFCDRQAATQTRPFSFCSTFFSKAGWQVYKAAKLLCRVKFSQAQSCLKQVRSRGLFKQEFMKNFSGFRLPGYPPLRLAAVEKRPEHAGNDDIRDA